MAQLVTAHLSSPPPRPSITQPNVPARVDEVIARGMAKDSQQRYAITTDLAQAARDAVKKPTSRPTPAEPPTEPAPGPVAALLLDTDATADQPTLSATPLSDATTQAQPSATPWLQTPPSHPGPALPEPPTAVRARMRHLAQGCRRNSFVEIRGGASGQMGSL
ncbi:MAG TPA: hypothetical protein VME67_15900 [Mycobacterium sp.]|nr:hypothetical protein [Mycobacterium sp.]HTX96207.1 hypothetical protein [Mycobacterium sp.]